MAATVVMPKLGALATDGILVKWLREDGATVKKGQPIAVVMSKKVSFEVEAPADGILHRVARTKETKPVGDAIALIAAPGEETQQASVVPALAAPQPAQAGIASAESQNPSIASGGFVVASPAARRVAKELGIELGHVKGSAPEGRVTEADVRSFAAQRQTVPAVPASSMARKLALEYGVDLTQIRGTGSGGRVTENDVQGFVEAQTKVAGTALASASSGQGVRTIPFAGMRQMIAESMTESLRTMAQLTVGAEVDVTEMVKLREQIKSRFDLTYTDIMVKAVTLALKEHPLVNSTLVDEEIRLLDTMHIGVAVALADGLIVPVVRDADKLTLAEVARETRRLAEAARSGTLTVDEVSGGTFTITNLGMFGADFSTPIVNPPEAAILGVGRILEKPAIYQGAIAKRSMMTLCLSFDHRIIDGAPAAQFLRALAGLLEKPYLLFV